MTDDRLCAACGVPLPAGVARCGACGAAILAAELLRHCEVWVRALASEWGNSPYFKDASALSYVARGQVRGFLDDHSHPLTQAMLRCLYRLARAGGPGTLRHLVAHARHHWLSPGSPQLARTFDHLYTRNRQALDAVAATTVDSDADAPFQQWLSGLTPHRAP